MIPRTVPLSLAMWTNLGCLGNPTGSIGALSITEYAIPTSMGSPTRIAGAPNGKVCLTERVGIDIGNL